MTIQRCGWCSSDPLYIAYHDKEWGKPEHDEAQLFEMLCLEGAAGRIVMDYRIEKRENYRTHFLSISHHADCHPQR